MASRFRVQPDGRTVVEVTEEDGSLAGMVTHHGPAGGALRHADVAPQEGGA